MSGPLVSLGHKHVLQAGTPLVVQQQQLQHVPPSKLKVLHAHPLTQSQRTALLGPNRTLTGVPGLPGLPAVVSLAALDNKPALLKVSYVSTLGSYPVKVGYVSLSQSRCL